MSRGEGSGEGEHRTLLQTYTLQSYGRVGAGTRPAVGLRKKPKDLRASESEERGHGWCQGDGVCVYALWVFVFFSFHEFRCCH